MSTEMQTKMQASPAQSFTPVQTGLLQRKCTLWNTPGLVEDSKRNDEKITSHPNSVEPRFGHDFSNVSVHSIGPGIQTKLKINEPGDVYEQEAERVAEQVMRMPESGVQRQVDPEEEEMIQAKPLADQTPEVVPSVENSITAIRGGGQPLSANERSFFEPRFGRDFSQVRVYSGMAAEQSARKINAKAYTVGHNIVFGEGGFEPGTHEGRRLIAHELTHVVSPSHIGILRAVASDYNQIKDRLTYGLFGRVITDKDAHDVLDILDKLNATDLVDTLTQMETDDLLSRLLENISAADRSAHVVLIQAMDKLHGIEMLTKQKTQLEATTKIGSGKSFGEVGSGFAKLKDVSHDLAVLKTGSGIYEGSRCTNKSSSATVTDCTSIVLEVLKDTFMQQGLGADWTKMKTRYAQNIAARGDTKLSGLDIQAALQSEAGWKGIYWAPDPTYIVPKAELTGAKDNEASYTAGIVKKKGTYYKDFGKKGYPGVSIDQSVTNYAPEVPNTGYGQASTTTKDTSQLNKLKKLPFGILAAHGGYHMTIITYGKVIEVHWSKDATDVDVIEQTDLEQWAIGPNSGYHYYASGAIVAPAAEVDKAFK